MDISLVLSLSVIFFGSYKIIEVFVRRKERLRIVDKIDVSKCDNLNQLNILQSECQNNKSTSWAILLGGLFIGVGLGILIGYFIIQYYNLYNIDNGYEQRNVIYGACSLLFGGLGLLITYFIENASNKTNKIK